MATGDRFFGFDLIQRKTLARLLSEVAGGDVPAFSDLAGSVAGVDGANLQAILEDLKDQIDAIEV